MIWSKGSQVERFARILQHSIIASPTEKKIKDTGLTGLINKLLFPTVLYQYSVYVKHFIKNKSYVHVLLSKYQYFSSVVQGRTGVNVVGYCHL